MSAAAAAAEAVAVGAGMIAGDNGRGRKVATRGRDEEEADEISNAVVYHVRWL